MQMYLNVRSEEVEPFELDVTVYRGKFYVDSIATYNITRNNVCVITR